MMNKKEKVLIITGFNSSLHAIYQSITKREQEDMIVLSSYNAELSQTYSCMIRSIIMLVLSEQIDEIYFIGERSNNDLLLNEEELLARMREKGVNTNILSTLNYLQVGGGNVIKWLTGENNMETIIKKNMNLVQMHPLIPKSIAVHGIVVDTKTNHIEMVS
ncbi:hypothetical protein [Bacillus sp. AFS040349]|uniref:hypothetical protein n=1 Tax=Bacillus sp. AFS040349 TaxID=2033502 RepID=UPI000BFBCF01|nr:hypothetical protein [Bacillus sp. AFS040349]PGT83903.1 hypothetical protein COD11_11960 [Bacillus sp. AFS040349]